MSIIDERSWSEKLMKSSNPMTKIKQVRAMPADRTHLRGLEQQISTSNLFKG